MTTATIAGRRVPVALRSACAVLAALIGVAVVTTATDQLFHELQVFPPWGQPMHEAGDNLLALSYRILFGVLGGYLAARLAPRAPLAHAAALGLVSIVLTAAGTAAVKASMGDVGPDWYPIALAITALPCTLLGARLATRRTLG
jgi:uncharacterized membrane protein YfcA